MKLIFLDIDGVIATPRTGNRIDRTLMERAIEIATRTGAGIVISSSWKEETLEKTLRKLPTALREHVVGQTPNLSNVETLKSREIDSFLNWFERQHGSVEKYIIIDDVYEGFSFQKIEHFVKTDTYEGLTEEDVKLAIKKLS